MVLILPLFLSGFYMEKTSEVAMRRDCQTLVSDNGEQN